MVRRNQAAPSHVNAIDLDEVELHVLSADLVLLTKPEDIIQAAKDEVLRSPAKPSDDYGLWWLPPHNYDALQGTAYDHSDIYVPVDERVEKRAQSLLRGPIEAISHSFTTHTFAIYALHFFKSDENISLLTGLLSDPDGPTRQEAYQVLKGWGLDVAKPVPWHQ
jgi:hypothetical protein